VNHYWHEDRPIMERVVSLSTYPPTQWATAVSTIHISTILSGNSAGGSLLHLNVLSRVRSQIEKIPWRRTRRPRPWQGQRV